MVIHFSQVQEHGGGGVSSTSFTVTMDMQMLYSLTWRLHPVAIGMTSLACTAHRNYTGHYPPNSALFAFQYPPYI